MFVVSFDKTFTAGLLVGMTVREEIRFPKWHPADRFAAMCDGVTERKAATGGAMFIASRPILEAVQAKAAA